MQVAAGYVHFIAEHQKQPDEHSSDSSYSPMFAFGRRQYICRWYDPSLGFLVLEEQCIRDIELVMDSNVSPLAWTWGQVQPTRTSGPHDCQAPASTSAPSSLNYICNGVSQALKAILPLYSLRRDVVFAFIFTGWSIKKMTISLKLLFR